MLSTERFETMLQYMLGGRTMKTMAHWGIIVHLFWNHILIEGIVQIDFNNSLFDYFLFPF